jgi:probable HAF family extracellular repeat protein
MKTTRSGKAVLDKNRAAEKSTTFNIVDLGPFENNRHNVLAINNVGQRAGVSLNPETGRIEAFMEGRSGRNSLGTLGGSFSVARGINDRGEVVGGSLTEGDENFRALIYSCNRLYDLNDCLEADCDWELIQAVGINNSGEIIAVGSHAGEDRIVLLRRKA